MPQTTFVLISLVSAFTLKLSYLVGIGAFLYSWGALDATIALAAWFGFKSWLYVAVTAFISLLVGLAGTAAYA